MRTSASNGANDTKIFLKRITILASRGTPNRESGVFEDCIEVLAENSTLLV